MFCANLKTVHGACSDAMATVALSMAHPFRKKSVCLQRLSVEWCQDGTQSSNPYTSSVDQLSRRVHDSLLLMII